jgi:hypothetical protein
MRLLLFKLFYIGSSPYSPPLFNQTAQPNWYHSAVNMTCQKNENGNLRFSVLDCVNLSPEFGTILTTVQIDPTPPLVGSSLVNGDPLACPPLGYLHDNVAPG